MPEVDAPQNTSPESTQPEVPEQTPAPAPVPPAPAPVPPVDTPEPAAVPEPDTPVGEYPSYDHPGIDLATKFLAKVGIGPDHPAIQAASETGDSTYLKAVLAELGDKARGWEQYVALAEKGFEEIQEKHVAREIETENTVYELVGGEDNWRAIQEWASSTADPEEKEEINAAFEAGGLQAKMAAAFLQQMHAAAVGVREPAPAVNEEAAPPTRAANGPLTPRDYATAVAALSARVGPQNVHTHPEYEALKQRRLAYRG